MDGWRNEKVLGELEMWTKSGADRFPFFLGKQTWLAKGEMYRETIVIYRVKGTETCRTAHRAASGGSVRWAASTTSR